MVDLPADDERIRQVQEADDPVTALYELGDTTEYGVGGALEDGVSIRTPDEIDGQANCYEQAVLNYEIAEAAGIEPRFFETVTRSPEMIHGFIEVRYEDDAYIIDPFQGMVGTVEGYSDTTVEIDPEEGHKGTMEINGIEELSYKTVEERINELRDDPVTMFEDGQRLYEFEDDGFRIYDKLQYNAHDHVLERTISFTEDTVVGYMNHNIRIERPIGAPEEETITFADTEDSIWRNFETGDTIAEVTADGYEIGDLSPSVRQQIAAVTSYEDQRPEGGLIADEDTLNTFWEQFQEDHEMFMWGSTVMNGNIAERFSNILTTSGDTFKEYLDWLHFVSDTDISYDSVDEKQVKTYLDRRHRSVLDTVQDKTGNIMDQADTLIAEQIDETAYTVGADRLAPIYDDLPEMVEKGYEMVEPLLFVDERARNQLQAVTDDPAVSSSLATIGSEELAYHDLFDDATVQWTMDLDTWTLTRTEELGASEFNIYTNQIELTYDLDPAGRVQDKTVSFTVTTELSDKDYTLFESTFEELADISFDDVCSRFEQRSDALLDRRNLEVPEPADDTGLIEDKWRSIALYASAKEGENVLFPDDELEMSFSIAKDEFETASSFTYPSHSEQQRVEQSLEVLEEIGDLDDAESYQIAEQNMVTAGIRQEDEHEIQQRVKRLDQDQKQDIVLWGFYDTMTAIDTEACQDRLELAKTGLSQYAPGADVIDRFADEEGYDRLETMNETIDSVGHSWEQKASIINENKDVFDEMKEREANQIITSIATRIADRKRYQAFVEETGNDLIGSLASYMDDQSNQFDEPGFIEV